MCATERKKKERVEGAIGTESGDGGGCRGAVLYVYDHILSDVGTVTLADMMSPCHTLPNWFEFVAEWCSGSPAFSSCAGLLVLPS